MFTPEQMKWLTGELKAFVDAHIRIAVALEQLVARRTPVAPITVDLDAGDGDPPVNFAPRAWKGDFAKGSPMSSFPADFLDVLAGALEQMAAAPKDGKEKFARGNAILAAKARAWAKRKRANGETSTSGSAPGGFVD